LAKLPEEKDKEERGEAINRKILFEGWTMSIKKFRENDPLKQGGRH